MGQASKEFFAKSTGEALRRRVVGLYKKGITMKRWGELEKEEKKKNTLYGDKLNLI